MALLAQKKGRLAVPFFIMACGVQGAQTQARYEKDCSRPVVRRALCLLCSVILPIFVFHSLVMRNPYLTLAVSAVVLVTSGAAWSQDRIYRCGNEYTNNPEQARLKNCRLVEGGNLTVVQGTRATTAPSDKPASEPRARPAPGADVPRQTTADPAAQRARESDARAILEAELRKAEDTLAQARQAFGNGQPDKQGPEFRNHQMYLDRVAQLQSAVQRAEADVNSIRRELQRLAGR